MHFFWRGDIVTPPSVSGTSSFQNHHNFFISKQSPKEWSTSNKSEVPISQFFIYRMIIAQLFFMLVVMSVIVLIKAPRVLFTSVWLKHRKKVSEILSTHHFILIDFTLNYYTSIESLWLNYNTCPHIFFRQIERCSDKCALKLTLQFRVINNNTEKKLKTVFSKSNRFIFPEVQFGKERKCDLLLWLVKSQI